LHEKERGESLKIIAKGISDIKPYENNPRNNDDAVDAVERSIKEFGWQQPIVVDKDNVIIAGHTRYKAAKKLGMKEVPVVVASNLSDEQVRAYRLADNCSDKTVLNLEQHDRNMAIKAFNHFANDTQSTLY
jgi:ParB/RepB/Spo0J family partition protein